MCWMCIETSHFSSLKMYWIFYAICFLIIVNEPLNIKGDDREHAYECDCPKSMMTTINTLAEDLKKFKLWITDEMNTLKSAYLTDLKNLTEDQAQLNNEFQTVFHKLTLTNGKINIIEKSLESVKSDTKKMTKEVEIEINNYTKVVQSYTDHFQNEKENIENQVLNINNTIFDREINLALFKKILHFQGIQSMADEKWSHSLAYTWIIEDIEKKLNNNTLDEESEEFLVEAYACAVRIKIKRTQENINFKLSTKPDHCLTFPLITFILRDENNSGFQREVIRSFSYSNDENLVNVNPYEDQNFMFKQSELKRSNLIINNSAKFEVHVEPLAHPNHAISDNGQLLWVIPNCKAKLEQPGIRFEMSPSFYTNRRGFRVQTIFTFNSKTRKLSAWVIFLRSFQWPVPEGGTFKFTFTIFNQEDAANNLIFYINLKNQSKIAVFYIDLVDYSRVKSILKSDNMFYKVSVERE